MSEPAARGEPSITVTEHGPYRVRGDVTIRDVHGTVLATSGTWCLCRCGGSRNKPFCDVTHGLKDFDGTETADHGSITQRRDSYPATDGVTIYDDRSRCAHFGQCTDTLPAVFKLAQEPWIDPDGAAASEVARAVGACPSGALAYAVGDDPNPVEQPEPPSITPIEDGPYRIQGAIQVVSADGRAYERRARQALCRCGHSRNKPFCDGSHWYAGFRDPAPARPGATPTLYDWAGGSAALQRLTTRFYDKILAEPDPVLEPIFRGMDRTHPQHVAAWLAETFGGPAAYTERHGGYEHMLAKHRNLGLTEHQRSRWVARMVETADEVGLPADPAFRSAFVAYLEWGTRIAVINSAPDATPPEHGPVPKWGWGQAPPFVPRPWDDPDAAERGRRRYAAERQVTPEPS